MGNVCDITLVFCSNIRKYFIKFQNNSGVSLIATVLTLLIFSLFIAIAVSLVTTGSNISLQEEQGNDAFFIADSGLEYVQFALTLNANWYNSTIDPLQISATNLGTGSFSVNINLPATLLRNRIPTGTSPNPIRVYTTNRFPSSGYLQIKDDITSDAEFIRYTGISGDTFTGIQRDQTIGGVKGTGSSHERGSRVYPVTTLSTGLGTLGGSCSPTSAASFTIAAHSKFLSSGTIDIEGEEISYTSSTVSGSVMTLNGVIRCLNSTSSAHSPGVPVTPILYDSNAPDFEAEIISTGTIANPLAVSIVRTVRKTVQR